jgi:ankyrin repeat protein
MGTTGDIFAATDTGDAAAVQQLIAADASCVHTRGEKERTPLIVAAREGHREIADLLLAHGADIEAKDAEHGSTPLIWAVFFGHQPVAEFLLAKGANVNTRNSYGSTALKIALDGANGAWKQESSTDAPTYNALAALLRTHGGTE